MEELEELELDSKTKYDPISEMKTFFKKGKKYHIESVLHVVLDSAISISCEKNFCTTLEDKYTLLKDEIFPDWNSRWGTRILYPTKAMSLALRVYLNYTEKEFDKCGYLLYSYLMFISEKDEYWFDKIFEALDD